LPFNPDQTRAHHQGIAVDAQQELRKVVFEGAQ